MLHFAFGNRAEENNGIGHPHGGNQNINRPFQLGIFLTLGVAQRQGNGGQHDNCLPTPEGERGQPAAEKARVTGALHNIIRRADKPAAAEGENHGVGMQRTDAPEGEPGADFGKVECGPEQFGGGIHADKHPNQPPNHRHHGELAHHMVVVGLRFCGCFLHGDAACRTAVSLRFHGKNSIYIEIFSHKRSAPPVLLFRR